MMKGHIQQFPKDLDKIFQNLSKKFEIVLCF